MVTSVGCLYVFLWTYVAVAMQTTARAMMTAAKGHPPLVTAGTYRSVCGRGMVETITDKDR